MVDGQRIIKKNLYLTQELKQLLTDPTTNKIFNKETKITTYKNDIYQIDLDMQDNVVKTMQTLTNKDDSTSTLEIYSATGRQVITNKDAYGKTTSTQTTQKVKFSGLAPWTETIISDANNQILSKKVIKTDGTSQLYTYDTTVKAQNGKSKQPATETSYDKNGNPISLQNNKPDGSYSITTYDPKIPNKIISKKSYTAPKTQGAQGTQTLGSFIKNIGN